jgi:hypothetical protein
MSDQEEVAMTCSLLSLYKHVGVAAAVFLVAGAAWAQVPDQPSSSPERPELRQPTPSSIQQQEGVQPNTDKSREEADRKLREMDRRLNRTLRSVCSRC